MIWCGDLNVAHHEIDLHNPRGKERNAGFTKEERASFGAFLESGYIDTFRDLHPKQVKYSYWNLRSGARQKDQGWRLDYFVVSKALQPRVLASEINNEYHGSDHCPLSLTLHIVDAAKPVKETPTEQNPEEASLPGEEPTKRRKVTTTVD